MKRFSFLALVATASWCCAQTPFRLDLFGYPTDGINRIVIANPQEGFNASESYVPSEELVLVGTEASFPLTINAWGGGATDTRSGDAGWVITLPSVPAGEYFVLDEATGAASDVFVVGTDVYNEVLKHAGRMFFLNRCGAEKPAENAGVWADDVAFNHPGQDTECRFISDPSNTTLYRDVSGGWFDAGDYNKYVTFSESAVSNLIEAYVAHPEVFGDDWDIPESGNGIPDLLDEIYWELQWLYRMTNTDGSCHIKVGSNNYFDNANSPASANFSQRYYGPTCTSASLSAAHILAKARWCQGLATQWPDDSELWLARAMACWQLGAEALQAGNLETDCDDGSIIAGDADRDEYAQTASAVAGAVYLWLLTGDAVYENFLIEFAPALTAVAASYWGPYALPENDALLHFKESTDANGALVNAIELGMGTYVQGNWDSWLYSTGFNLYQAYMPEYAYHWGSNQVMASAGILQLQLLGTVGYVESEALEKAAAHLHYLHGLNPLGACYLTNMEGAGAEKSMTEMYHTAFGEGSPFDDADTGPGPPPGYLVGGPNQWFSVPTLSPPAQQPLEKSYRDFNAGWPENSWEVSEPAIYYQAAYLRLLSHFCVPNVPQHLAADAEISPLQFFPNPTNGWIRSNRPLPAHADVYGMDGKRIARWKAGGSQWKVNAWKPGVYVVQTKGQRSRIVVE